MRLANTYTPHDFERLLEWQKLLPDGRLVPARPLGFVGRAFKQRARLAWRVFTGKADVLEWDAL